MQDINRIEALFDTETQAKEIQESTLILGLHPDGAINELLTSIKTYQKSFAIVPCCVFPRTFERQLKSGE